MEDITKDLEKLPEFIRLTKEGLTEIQKNGKWNNTPMSKLLKEEVEKKLEALEGDTSPMEKMKSLVRISGEYKLKREELQREKKPIKAMEKKQKIKVPRIIS